MSRHPRCRWCVITDASPRLLEAEGILSHLNLPLTAEQLSDDYNVGYDVTGKPMPGWALGTDPEVEEEARGPPSDWALVDPPAPED